MPGQQARGFLGIQAVGGDQGVLQVAQLLLQSLGEELLVAAGGWGLAGHGVSRQLDYRFWSSIILLEKLFLKIPNSNGYDNTVDNLKSKLIILRPYTRSDYAKRTHLGPKQIIVRRSSIQER